MITGSSKRGTFCAERGWGRVGALWAFVRPSRGRESVPSEPPRLRDICIDHTSCPAPLRTPQTGPERAHAAPGAQSGPGHRMYKIWRILR